MLKLASEMSTGEIAVLMTSYSLSEELLAGKTQGVRYNGILGTWEAVIAKESGLGLAGLALYG
jgi:hypothetical protein